MINWCAELTKMANEAFIGGTFVVHCAVVVCVP